MSTDEEAMDQARRAVAAWYDGDLDRSGRLFRHLLAGRPDFHLGHYLYGTLLLALGQWREAWPFFERRVFTPQYAGFVRYPARFWQGEAVAPDSTLVVFGDMGRGDVIMCARFVTVVARRFSRTTFVVPAGMKRLMTGLDPAIHIVEHGEHVPAATHAAFAFSLMRFLDVTPDTIDNRPYLTPDPQLVERWRQPGPGPAVGLAWRGSPLHARDAERSMDLAQLAPLLSRPGIRFVSLQQAPTAEELAAMRGRIEHDDAMNATLADTAAAIAGLDLVITIDSAMAHLAGALGKPVWIALQSAPDWRWLPDRPDTVWYRGARLFRQHRRHDWAPVIADMARGLIRYCATRSPAR